MQLYERARVLFGAQRGVEFAQLRDGFRVDSRQREFDRARFQHTADRVDLPQALGVDRRDDGSAIGAVLDGAFSLKLAECFAQGAAAHAESGGDLFLRYRLARHELAFGDLIAQPLRERFDRTSNGERHLRAPHIDKGGMTPLLYTWIQY